MECRPSDKIPGVKAWLHHINQYPLPDGAADRLPVTIISHSGGIMDEAVVRTESGDDLRIRLINVQTPWLYHLPGRRDFALESAPEVLDILQARLTAERGKTAPHGIEPDMAEFLSDLEWILRRNGREPLA